MAKHKEKPVKTTTSKYATVLTILGIVAFLFPFYLFLYKVYVPYINAFGCFDECMNIGGGYFMTQGKTLFSEIWFNHQPLMGYFSYIIQTVLQPINLYELLLRHLQFLMIFSLIANFFIIKRFGWTGVGFVLIYELSKFYIFGNRFLGESFVVYPLVYMLGLLWNKYSDKQIYKFEYIAAGISTWFILFTREPFSLTALALYGLLLWKPQEIDKRISLMIFGLLSAVTVLVQPLDEYFYALFAVSSQGTLENELQNNFAGIGILKVFFYPFFIVIDAFNNQINEYWMLLIGVCITFILVTIYMLIIRKRYIFIAVLYFLLGLTNLRYLPFGDTYYGAFHIIPWYAMVIFISLLLITDKFTLYKKYTFTMLVIIFGFFLAYLVHPATFFKHPVDPQRDLLVNYGEVMQIGSIVNALSESNASLFVDKAGANDTMALAYFTAKRQSAYDYSWYIYFAPGHKRYTEARSEMLQEYPPDFYYTGSLDKRLQNVYQQLVIDNKPSKLYVKKDMFKQIPNERFEKAKEHALTR